MRRLALALFVAALAGAAHADTLCPDGTFVPGDSCMLSFDGSHVIGGPKTLPDVVYVDARSAAILLRYDAEYRIGQPQRNRILDAPPGTPAIEIPRLGR
ncbi:MAG TPA: hypothetical protein VFE89_19450 [Beijerinckiaceae bacterium]|jgi:hypothetical protein|nr:hypothetical protein [Beijerinckiaceae bacterium]